MRTPIGEEKMHDKVSNLLYAAIPAAIIYFAGIIYISSYLSHFGLSIHEIELDVPIALSYSANVLLGGRFIISSFIIVCMVLIINYSYTFDHFERWPSKFLTSHIGMSLAIVIFSFVLFLLVSWSAAAEAQHNAKLSWTMPMASVIPRKLDVENYASSSYNKALIRYCLSKKSFQYVFSTKTETYFMCRKIKKSGKALLIGQRKFDESVIIIRSIDDKW